MSGALHTTRRLRHSVPGSFYFNNTLRTGFGTGRATAALLLLPDKFIPPRATGDYQFLFRVLRCDWMTEEMFEGYRHSFGNTVTVTFQLQLCPILV
jgi:hypothetical protein